MRSTAHPHTSAAPRKHRRSPYERPTSPPQLSRSPVPSASSSLDRSGVSTPPAASPSSYQQPNHYAAYDPRSYPGGYAYAAPPADYQPHPDGHQYPAHAQYRLPYGYVAHPHPGTILSAPQGTSGGGTAVPVVHTDDAATKLSDRVRRRCFNCCTTDTSTWRRSNLSPGKVLCNKCGLFERTHSRPRPEQFPHKRGPLASSTLRSRSPPPAPVRGTHILPWMLFLMYYTRQAQPPLHAPPTSVSAVQQPQTESTSPPSADPLSSTVDYNRNGAGGSASHPGTPKQQHQNRSSHSSRPASRDGRAEESSVRDCK
ncbi:hypothetical protein C8R47DRAFT_995880 [Mycena vitilis]|nr:hypothetical protein C8R47DRAFT_995880 [Mycena vitilis]